MCAQFAYLVTCTYGRYVYSWVNMQEVEMCVLHRRAAQYLIHHAEISCSVRHGS